MKVTVRGWEKAVCLGPVCEMWAIPRGNVSAMTILSPRSPRLGWVGQQRDPCGPIPSLLCPLPAGTSNWSEDYFSSTSGVGLVVSQRASGAQPGVSTVQEQLRQLFERDWSSRYAVGLDGQAQGQDCAWQG